jgi:hypothetical protein
VELARGDSGPPHKGEGGVGDPAGHPHLIYPCLPDFHYPMRPDSLKGSLLERPPPPRFSLQQRAFRGPVALQPRRTEIGLSRPVFPDSELSRAGYAQSLTPYSDSPATGTATARSCIEYGPRLYELNCAQMSMRFPLRSDDVIAPASASKISTTRPIVRKRPGPITSPSR